MSYFLREGAEAGVRHGGPLAIIDLKGDLITNTEHRLREAHKQAVESGARAILLNFSETPYFNSSGIAVILEFLSEAREQGRLLLFTGLTPHFRKIFQIMGLTQYADYVNSEDEARELVGGKA